LFSVGLVLARTAVSLTQRVFVPILLTLLALLFGPALRRAARAVADAGRRASTALDGALRGVQRQPTVIDTEGEELPAERHASPRHRTRSGRVRVVIDEDDDEHEDDASDDERERRRRHPRRWY
jgi:hypothetical protein